MSSPLFVDAVVLSSFNNTCNVVVLFLQKAFKQKKTSCNSREFIWYLFSMQFHLPPISVTWSVPPQPSKLASEKIVRSLCIFWVFCNAFDHMEQLSVRTLSLLWFVLVLWLLLGNLKGYSGKVCKWIVSFPQSELIVIWQSITNPRNICCVGPRTDFSG